MAAVHMPTVQHLLNGSLDALREAIQHASTEEEPVRWVVSHIILGSSLRLRGSLASDEDRARMFSEAIRAFDMALTVCAQTGHCRMQAITHGGAFSMQQSTWTGPDGVQLVVDSAALSAHEGNEMLERAVRVFRETCKQANRRTQLSTWFIAMSNLGCALTLLACRTPGMEGIPLLEEAVDVLQDALRVPLTERLAQERATTQVNLSEALRGLAERAMPAESLRYLEQAVDWLAAALGHFAPAEYRWLLHLERGRVA